MQKVHKNPLQEIVREYNAAKRWERLIQICNKMLIILIVTAILLFVAAVIATWVSLSPGISYD